MNITRQRILFVVIALGMSFSVGAFADDRTADEILEAYKAVKSPVYDKEKKDDKEFMDKFWEDYKAANIERAELIGELFKVDPDNERLTKLMPTRWRTLQGDPEQASLILDEQAKILADSPDSKLAIEVRYAITIKIVNENIRGEEKNFAVALGAIDKFIEIHTKNQHDIELLQTLADTYESGSEENLALIEASEKVLGKHVKDPRGASLLQNLARAYEFGSEEQLALYERIVNDYPENSKYIGGKLQQVKSVGKPFELTFQDAITGTKINMKNLKGQVVVLDFWATWCGPCVAEMPKMKELYAKFHDEGVQFIGISLDNPEDKGGLDKLKKYVDENEIPWPQYYQGNGWASEFSTSWGINSIPALFVVDKDGNLNSVQARGKLEDLIPELLAD